MPGRPPIEMGMYDPAKYKRDYTTKVLVKLDSREYSKTPVQTVLRIADSEESITLPVMTATTVWDVKEMVADRLGVEVDTLRFFAKQGCYLREQKDCEEIRRQVLVRGINSFERQRMSYPHPVGIIGAGHIGLRTAMIFLKYKDYNFVIFDKKPKVGGMAWWDQANSTSKLQTELGVYHLNFDETMPLPTKDYPWPSRDELLQMFEEVATQYGVIPYCRMNTNVRDLTVIGKREEATYELLLERTDGESREASTFMTSAVFLFPGNLSLPRRETYKGEEHFGGEIAYGMFDEFDYSRCTGKNVAIIGHGAFAVENVRTCCEFSAKKIYIVCRRKNISCPRFVSWMANQSGVPVSASLFLNACKPMYDLIGWDAWSYYAVQANSSRTTCSIVQKARFGIGDVYFLALSWGKLEVIEDQLGIKRLSEGALHCGNGRKLDVDVILKLLGFVGNPDNDRLLKVKELVGFWVNDDPKRYVVAEPISVMASNFGGTSFSPGAIAWAEMGMWFVHHPKDWYGKVLQSGLMPRHKAESDDRPAYVVDARHGTSTGVLVSSCIPFLGERGAIESELKVSRMHSLHPIDKFIQYCKEDWDYYCERFRAEGLSGPEFPYTPEVAHKYFRDYQEESAASMAKMAKLQGR